LALVEAGIHLHPSMLIPRKKPKPQIVFEEPEPAVYEEPETEVIEETQPKPEPIRLLWLALFPADKTVPDAQGLAALDEAAAVIIDAETEYTLVLKGYAAPFVSVEGQNTVSRDRAFFCKNYLIEKYGIQEDRITVEWYGSQKIPENVNNYSYSQHRSVEIIFEGFIPHQTIQEQGEEK